MKYITEYRNKNLSKKIADKTNDYLKDYKGKISLMEVCGTHTHSIFHSGIMSLLSDKIEHLSGPGCPVCVTPNEYIDTAIAYSRLPEVIITTFGDMIKVPGSSSSLEKEKANGAKVKIVYSPLESLEIARKNPGKKVVFLGVGFETTAPLVASTILRANEEKLKNFFVLSGHKLIPPAMQSLLESGEIKIDGFICPGHVSAIIGETPYQPIVDKYGIPSVIIGFEPIDLLEGIEMLVRQIVEKDKSKVENQYKRVVRREGNKKALSLMNKVFDIKDSPWRGLGLLPKSGLYIKKAYSEFDAEKKINVKVEKTKTHPQCICGQVLCGTKKPFECTLFSKICTPESPIGPCMVSSEGTCAAYYKFKKQ
ncbi:hydrogenase formation protein HypD [candidate division WOR-3 bacterium]|nr:hydrogenase formation protein HypD [candidate division WOR-3 bacterium]